MHQHAGFLTKRLSWCHTRLCSITIVRFNDCDGDEEDDEEDDDDVVDDDDDDDDDDKDDDDDDEYDDGDNDDNKVWWCSSGWGCYNNDIEGLFLLSALSRKRRHADHSEVWIGSFYFFFFRFVAGTDNMKKKAYHNV